MHANGNPNSNLARMAIKTRLTPEAIQSLQAEDETKALDGGAPMDITAAVRNERWEAARGARPTRGIWCD
jgi:hypothetical protein